MALLRTTRLLSRGLATAVATALVAAAPAVPALAAAPGDPDPGFGFGSKVTTGISQYGDDAAAAVKADFDGKIVAAGRSGNSFAVVRYNANGTLDTSFGGGDGVVTTSFGAGLEAQATNLAIDPDGPIVVVGSVRPPFNLGGQESGDFAVARYDENGNLDPGFGGGDGLVTTELGESDDAEDVAIQADGAIVVAGSSGGQGFGLVRYEPDGDPDPTFSGDGEQTTNFGADLSANGRGVAIQSNGAIVVAGFTTDSGGENDFALARYLSNGDLDTAGFGGGDGLVTTDFNGGSDDDGQDVVIQGGGEIVVAGHSNGDFALARYLSSGTLDTASFGGGDGLVTADLGGATDRANEVALTPGSTILATGTSGAAGDGEFPVDGQFALASFASDGTPDAGFGGGDGEVLTDFGAATSDVGNGLAIMSGGQIVVAGAATPPFTSFEIEPGELEDFILAQYDSSGALDATFSGDGKVETVVGNGFGDRAHAVAVQDDGKIVAVGYSIDEQGPDDPDFAIARYETDGDPDTSFSGNGVLTTDLSGQDLFDVAHAVAVQDDGKIVVAGSSNGELAVARYQANGDLDSSFSTDGWLTTDFGPELDEGRDIAIQADGRIVVSGSATSGGLALARYLSNGDPDGTFGGGDGKLTDAFGEGFESGNGVAIQSNGAIVATAHVGIGFGLARYEPDGDPDTSFGGGDGQVTTDFGSTNDRTGDVLIQPDGAIVVAGGVGRPDTPIADCGGVPEMDMTLARYAANGDPDASFGGGDGEVTTDFSGAVDEAFGLVLQPDGAIAAAGRSNTDFALARYAANGEPDMTFSGDGRVTTDFGAGSCDVASDAALSQGGLLLAGFARDGVNSRFALARYIATVPAAPTITGTDPNSPSSDNTPLVQGTVGSGDPTQVKLYTNATCTGPEAATGTVTQFTGAGIEVSVTENQTTNLSARATDTLGTDSECSNSIAYTEDSAAPDTTITAGPSGPTNNPTPTFAFSSSEPGSTFACRVDAAPFAPCSGPGDAHTTAPLADGAHTFEVRASDAAGNIDPTPATRAFTVDTALPDTVPPEMELDAKMSQDAGKQKGVIVVAACPTEACTLKAKGVVKGASRLKLKSARAQLPAGGEAKLKLKVSKKVLRKIEKALDAGAKVKAKLTVSARDVVGNKTTEKSTVKLK